MTNDPIIAAHKHSIRHYDEINRSAVCGCFQCCRTFATSQIADWIRDGDSDSSKTAQCPYCGIDSVIGDASGYDMNTEFLQRMNTHWF